jgi:hypothetical protein
MSHGRRCRTGILAVSVVVASACGGTPSGDRLDVTSQTVKGETTQTISVFAPDADGS